MDVSKARPKRFKPRPCPALALLPAVQAGANHQTEALVGAVLAVADQMCWNSTYSQQDVGGDFLERYGWFDLIGPTGPYEMKGLRVMFGFWDKGLVYQKHWHDPIEAYLPIAGRARFWSETRGTQEAGIGDIIIHQPREKHATHFDLDPLLTLAIWKGDDCAVRPIIESAQTGKPVRASRAET